MPSYPRILLIVQNRVRRALPRLRNVLLVLLMIGGSVFLSIYIGTSNPPANLQQFSSISELSQHIRSHNPPPLIGMPEFPGIFLGLGTGNPGGQPPSLEGTSGYSTTNIQVEGVDEPDIVKTDGSYIYTIIDTEIVVIETYPPTSAEVIARIQSSETPEALFLFASTKLVVLAVDQGLTIIEIYDVSNPRSIIQSSRVTISGRYRGARMIGPHLYLIASAFAGDGSSDDIPTIVIGSNRRTISIQDVYYDPGEYDWSFCFQMIISLDVFDVEASLNTETILTGSSTSTLYSSLNNIYLAISRYPIFSRNWFDKQTTIHRFELTNGGVSYQASGYVPGYLINQFALDESGGYLRVATTSLVFSIQNEAEWFQVSNVYILDMELKTCGRVEGLAPGEQIYSVRFIGNTGYLVTFWKVDPLFLIDLTDPFFPRLMGELVMPGYSDYLHPLDNGFLLGIGKETVVSESGDFWWYQGVKVSLFNTTDPSSPDETDRLVIGVRGTDSDVLHDHRAILVDTQRDFFAMPILLCEYVNISNPEPNLPGTPVWQGVYMFKTNTSNGDVELWGKISHLEDSEGFPENHWKLQAYFIHRSLYIGDVLYTLSAQKLMYHSLVDLSYIGEISLV